MAHGGHQKHFLDISRDELNTYIQDNLQPDQDFLSECGENMDFLADYLKTRSGFSVAATIKGGSLGKGTALKGRSDLDVVLYLANEFKDMDDFIQNVKQRVIKRLEGAIRAWSKERKGRGRVEIEGTTGHAVKIRVRYSKENGTDFVDVDLLPAYDLLREGKNTAYQRMQHRSEHHIQMLSGSFVPLQLEFVTKQPPNVKNLIRLVKFWRKTMFEERSHGALLPTSYVFELLTIYAWEQAGSPDRFDTAKGFMAVLKILKDFQHIDVSWNVNYNKGSYKNVARKMPNKPFILDPANPFNNVCVRFTAWPEVSQVAHQSLERPLLRGINITRRGQNNHGYNWN